MIYDLLIRLLKKHFYILYSEKFKNESSMIYLERFVAKHPLLKPELIVVNDQIHGFKRVSEHLLSLENYPIYFEIEYTESNDEKFVENVDLYAEARVKYHKRLTDLAYLGNIYAKTIIIEQLKRLNEPSQESILIYSRLNEQFNEGYVEQDMEEGLINENELHLLMDVNMLSFVNFIKLMDDIVVKGKRLDKINTLPNAPDTFDNGIFI